MLQFSLTWEVSEAFPPWLGKDEPHWWGFPKLVMYALTPAGPAFFPGHLLPPVLPWHNWNSSKVLNTVKNVFCFVLFSPWNFKSHERTALLGMALFTWMLGRLYCKFNRCLNSATATGKTARVVCVCMVLTLLVIHLTTLTSAASLQERKRNLEVSMRTNSGRFDPFPCTLCHFSVFTLLQNFLLFF